MLKNTITKELRASQFGKRDKKNVITVTKHGNKTFEKNTKAFVAALKKEEQTASS